MKTIFDGLFIIFKKKARIIATKKNVDTKASKNRKIRFDKHEKIINFMTPQINLNEAIGRDIIVNSLFGIKKKIENKKNEEEIENDVDII